MDKIKDTFKSFFSKNRAKKNYQTHTSADRKKSPAVSRPKAGGTPVMGEPGGSKVRSSAVASRSRTRGAVQKKNQNFFVSGLNHVVDYFKTAKLANKKRFSMVMIVVVAAVLVPVIAVSANAGADHSAKAAEGDQTVNGAMPVSQQQYANGAAPAAAVQADIPAQGEGEVVEWQEQIDPEELAAAEAEQEPEPQYLELVPESQSPDVIKLQQRLMDLYYMDNDEPTDYYGPMTQQAVGYFQRKHDLTVDGVAGVETQKLLFSEDAKPYSVTIGGEGMDVSNIQDRLRDLGYSCGSTGYFGEETEKAIKYFQRMNGLDDDGSVGHYTKELLFSDDAEPSLEYGKKEESSGGGKSSGGGVKSSGGGGGSSGGGSTSHVANPGSRARS
jgi:peptidoglycan hydrolase-like protein with peptidoglycan-binding domain